MVARTLMLRGVYNLSLEFILTTQDLISDPSHFFKKTPAHHPRIRRHIRHPATKPMGEDNMARLESARRAILTFDLNTPSLALRR